jgi:hypothetical protein
LVIGAKPRDFPQNSELSSVLNVTQENHQTTMSPDLVVSNLIQDLVVFLTPWFSPGTFFLNSVVAFSLKKFSVFFFFKALLLSPLPVF